MSAERSLSDTWHGRYAYPAQTSLPVVPFVMSLLEQAGQLAGASHETTRHGQLATASIEGARDGGVVRFVKTYSADAGARFKHPVHYEGALSDDASEISGVWRVRSWTGKFVMRRANRQAFAVHRRVAQPAPA